METLKERPRLSRMVTSRAAYRVVLKRTAMQSSQGVCSGRFTEPSSLASSLRAPEIFALVTVFISLLVERKPYWGVDEHGEEGVDRGIRSVGSEGVSDRYKEETVLLGGVSNTITIERVKLQ